MATANSTRRKTPTTTKCSYCHRTATKTVVADHRIFCGKLCAALGLIAAVHQECGIAFSVAADSFEILLNDIERGDPKMPLYPLLVRWSDAVDGEGHDDERAVVVPIDDESTADWMPGPIEALENTNQEQVDLEVESILRVSQNSNGEVNS